MLIFKINLKNKKYIILIFFQIKNILKKITASLSFPIPSSDL